jgi:hypothetical protein
MFRDPATPMRKTIPRYVSTNPGQLSKFDLLGLILPVEKWHVLQNLIEFIIMNRIDFENAKELPGVYGEIKRELDAHGWGMSRQGRYERKLEENKLRYPCKICNVTPGSRCIMPNGTPRNYPHTERGMNG